ncbi:MAG: phenylalanine--tRNA ligase beta subunit-related protein [Nitrosopumilus sp.]|nr:phenylalanine--tRNA ligase beta subunit-related protein [Nitrosopumilus sp.]
MSEQIKFKIKNESKEKLHDLKIGFACFEKIKVQKNNDSVEKILNEAIEFAQNKFSDLQTINDDNVVKSMRNIFSSIGIDPTKERPSGEALLRRIISGKGVYRINTIVDANNAVSIFTGFPCGVYDLSQIEGEIEFTVGTEQEFYEGIGGKSNSAKNRIVTKDNISIFGSPVADSKRTSINPNTTNLLMLIYFPHNISEELTNTSLKKAIHIIHEVSGGINTQSGIFLTN